MDLMPRETPGPMHGRCEALGKFVEKLCMKMLARWLKWQGTAMERHMQREWQTEPQPRGLDHNSTQYQRAYRGVSFTCTQQQGEARASSGGGAEPVDFTGRAFGKTRRVFFRSTRP